MSVGTGRQNVIILYLTVSFLGIHKWEQYIYIGFSPALHLQCIASHTKTLMIVNNCKIILEITSPNTVLYTYSIWPKTVLCKERYPSDVSPTKVSAKLAYVKIFYFLSSLCYNITFRFLCRQLCPLSVMCCGTLLKYMHNACKKA
jgi:hypothetical protein